MYNWFRGCTVNEFEEFVRRNDSQDFVYNPGEGMGTVYLINYQERTIIKVTNKEVLSFFYSQVYMATINETYIDGHISLGNFNLKEWK